MPRAALSQLDVDRFREELCAVATRRFAEHGYAGVTLRALAAELGCSAMTPYRYFENKQAIFDAVRTASFARFADAQEQAARSTPDPLARLHALGRAYVRFALDEPHAYRIMFELGPSPDERAGQAHGDEARAWQVMRTTVGDAVAAGDLEGDSNTLAHLFWCCVHGLVALHLADKLRLGRSLEDLVEPMLDRALTPHPHHSKEPIR